MNQVSSTDAIVQEIEIHAPAERIFEALVDPVQRLEWWGVAREGAAKPSMQSDLRPGGKWEMHFDSWSGQPSSVRGEYREIDPPHLLSFTWLPDWYEEATETLVRIDLRENAGVTTVRLTHSGLATEGDRSNHRGWPHLLSALQKFAEARS
jgi:uncharacterized protein YndB with AHSA1/START domain